MSEAKDDDVPSKKQALDLDAKIRDELGGDDVNLQAVIDSQRATIDAEVNSRALYGSVLPTSSLVEEFSAEASSEFHASAAAVAGRYAQLRRVRGDGNCFFRALISAQFERCRVDAKERARFLSLCLGWLPRLLALGFPDMTTSDFCETFTDFLDTELGSMDEAALAEVLNNDGLSNYHICFARLVASGYLQEKKDDYEPFLEGGQSMSEFVKSEVEPMYKEADHVVIQATVLGLGLRVRVEYLDRRANPAGAAQHLDLGDGDGDPPIRLLFRPGHYDLLYL